MNKLYGPSILDFFGILGRDANSQWLIEMIEDLAR